MIPEDTVVRLQGELGAKTKCSEDSLHFLTVSHWNLPSSSFLQTGLAHGFSGVSVEKRFHRQPPNLQETDFSVSEIHKFTRIPMNPAGILMDPV